MAKYSNTIEYNIKTNLDASGLTKLQNQIQQVEQAFRRMGSTRLIDETSMNKALADLNKLQSMLNKSFNARLGMFDVKAFSNQLAQSGKTLQSYYNTFSKAGVQGQQAFAGMVTQLGHLDTNLKQTSKTADKIFNTLGNTVRWGVIASGFQYMMNSVHNTVQYMRDLDESLTNIRLVSNYSKEEMRDFALYANQAAKSLGNTTTAYTNAALIYAQQGFNLEDQKTLANTTLKVANVTGVDSADVSDQVTAVMNGFQLSVEETNSAFDKLAKVANVSAADVEELATAASRSAASANSLGVSQDQLYAQIATIVSVTRDAPENVGNALKTIYARLADLKMTGSTTDEDGTTVTLGTLSTLLENQGVEVLDERTGEMRGVGDIMEDLMEKWQDFDSATKAALAPTLAGKYQNTRFTALMENMDMYTQYLSASRTSEGTLDVMQDEYLESLQGRISQLQASFEGLMSTLFNQDDMTGFIQALTQVVDLFQQLVESIGGGGAALQGMLAVATRMFSGSIGKSLATIVTNRQKTKMAASNVEAQQALFRDQHMLGRVDPNDSELTSAYSDISRAVALQPYMSDEQREQFNKSNENRGAALEQYYASRNAFEEMVEQNNLNYSREGGGVNLFGTEYDEGGKVELKVDPSVYEVEAEAKRWGMKTGKDAPPISDELRGIMAGFQGNLTEYMNQLAQGNVDEANGLLKNEIKRQRGVLAEQLNVEGYVKDFSQAIAQDLGTIMDPNSDMDQKQKARNKISARFAMVGQPGFSTEEMEAAADRANRDKTNLDVLGEEQRGILDNVELQKNISQVTELMGGIQQLGFAITSLQNLGSIWSNEDMEIGEKIFQTILNLATTIPMVVTGLMPLKDGFNALGTLAQQYVDNSQKESAARLAHATAAGVEAEAVDKESLAEGKNAASKNVTTDKTNKQTAGRFGNLKSIGSAIATFAKNNVILLGVAAAAGVVGLAIKALYDAYNKDARAAEEASERAKALSEAYDAAAEAKDNFDTSLENYESLKNQLSDLESGTDEWKDKLQETNDVVLELLDNFPELAKYVQRGENGLLTFSDKGIEEVRENLEEAEKEARQISLIASAQSAEADQKALETSTRRKVGYMTTTSAGATAVPVFNTLTESQMNSLMEMMETQGPQALYDNEAVADALGVNVANPIVDAVHNNTDVLAEAFRNRENAEESARIMYEEAIRAELEGDANFQGLSNEEQNAVISQIIGSLDTNSDTYKEEYNKVKSKSNEQVSREYAELMHWDYTGQENNNQVTFRDSTGTEQYISLDDIRSVITSHNITTEAAASWQSMIYEPMQSANNSVIGQNYQGSGQVIATGTKESGFDFSGMSNAALSQLTGADITAETLGISDEEAQNRGFADGQEYAEEFVKGAEEALDSRELGRRIITTDEEGRTVEEETGWDRDEYGRRYSTVADMDEYEVDQYLADSGYTEEQYQSAYAYTKENTGDEEGEFSFDLKALEEQRDELQKNQEALDENSDEYKENAKELEKLDKEIAQYTMSIDDMAVMTMNTRQGLDELAEGLDDNRKALEENEKGSKEYENALESIRGSVSKVLNVDPSLLSDDFLTNTENLDLMAQAAQGSTEALDLLQKKAGQEVIQNIKINGPDEATTASLRKDLSDLAATLPDVEVGADIDNTPFMNKLVEMYKAGQITVTDMNNILQTMGYDLQVEWIEMDFPLPNVEPVEGSPLPKITFDMTPVSVPYFHAVKMNDGGGWTAPPSGDTPPSTAPDDTGGGGGGGGGGSSYTPKTKDPIEDEIDRYQDVETRLEAIANDLDRIGSEQDRLAGWERIDNMEQQVGLLERQVELEQRKLEIQRQEAQELRNSLAAQYGLQFDESGFITNYADVHQRLIDEVNGLIDQYNADGSESGQESLEEQIEDAQERLDDFVEDYERYDELISSDMKDTQQQIEDLKDSIEDLQIEAFSTWLDSIDNINDLNESLGELQETMGALFNGFEDDPMAMLDSWETRVEGLFDNATGYANEFYDELIGRIEEQMEAEDLSAQQREALQKELDRLNFAKGQAGAGTLEEGGTGTLDMIMTATSIMQDQIRQYEETGTSTIFGENSAELYEKAQDVFEMGVEYMGTLRELGEDARELVLESIDKLSDTVDNRMQLFEDVADQLDHLRNVTEMIEGDQSFESINAIIDKQVANNTQKMNELEQVIAIWQESAAGMEEGSEQWLEVQDQIRDAQGEINDLVENSLDLLTEKYENTVQTVLDTWVEGALGTSDLDWFDTEWELMNRNEDQLLDEVNSTYEVEKLQRAYNDLLDSVSGDLSLQQMVTEQMREQFDAAGGLNDILATRGKLSQYEVDYANAQLEILQKRIALEDAQRNKSQMRLRRDSQGNYSYVYTANDEDVSDAEGALMDAQNSAYNLSKDQLRQVQEDSYSALQDAQSVINDIWTNANLTLEQKQERTQEIIRYLREYLEVNAEQMGIVEENIITDYIDMVEMFANTNNSTLQEVYGDLIAGQDTAFNTIDDRWSTSITNWLNKIDSFSDKTTAALEDDLAAAFESLETSIAESTNSSAEDLGNLQSGAEDAGQAIKDLINTQGEFISQAEQMSGAITKSQEAFNKYAADIMSLENKLSLVTQEMENLKDQITKKDLQINALQGKVDMYESAGAGGGSGSGSGGGFGGTGYAEDDLAWGIAQNIWTYGTGKKGGWGNNPTRSSKLTSAYGAGFASKVQNLINTTLGSGRESSLVNKDSEKFSSYNLIGYDTGGYTGTWDTGEGSLMARNGKLAFLHQKELVLNETDTANILSAVNAVRTMTLQLKNGVFDNVVSNLTGTGNVAPASLGATDVEQEVHITAEFPNANDAVEIREAILSLNDVAVQYAFRRS